MVVGIGAITRMLHQFLLLHEPELQFCFFIHCDELSGYFAVDGI